MPTLEQQAQIARTITGSKLDTEIIASEVKNVETSIMKEACQKVHEMVIKNNMPFDKVFSSIRVEFNQISEEYKLDPAVLFWIYMDWLKKQNK